MIRVRRSEARGCARVGSICTYAGNASYILVVSGPAVSELRRPSGKHGIFRNRSTLAQRLYCLVRGFRVRHIRYLHLLPRDITVEGKTFRYRKKGAVLHFFLSYIRFLSESSAILIYTSDIAFESTSLLFRKGMCARMAVTLRSIPSREVLDPPFRTTTTTGIRCKRCFVALAKFLRDIILRAAAARFGSVADTEEHFTRNAFTRNVLFRG